MTDVRKWFKRCGADGDNGVRCGDWLTRPDSPLEPLSFDDRSTLDQVARGFGWQVLDGVDKCPRCIAREHGEKLAYVRIANGAHNV